MNKQTVLTRLANSIATKHFDRRSDRQSSRRLFMSRNEVMFVQDIAGMRDMLTHAYFGIDNNILWDVVQNKIPQLAKAINAFLNKE